MRATDRHDKAILIGEQIEMNRRYAILGLSVFLALALAVPALGGPSNPVASLSATAKSIANKALKKAKTAQKTANSANSTANAALTEAKKGVTNAATAQAAADSAKGTADSAKAAADAAKAAAEAAEANANTRLKSASQVFGTSTATNTETDKNASVTCPAGQRHPRRRFRRRRRWKQLGHRHQLGTPVLLQWLVRGRRGDHRHADLVPCRHCHVRGDVAASPSKSASTGASRARGPSYVREHILSAFSDRRRIALAAILLVAAVLRVAAIEADSGYRPANDAFEYDYYARAIAGGDGYPRSGYLRQGGPTAIRGPSYPYLLGGVYAVSGDSIAAGRLFGAALGVLAVLLIHLIAKRIWGARIGLVAAAIAAVFPPLVLLSRDLVSESLFIALVLGVLFSLLEFRRTRALPWAAGAGALCGVAILTRNTGFAMLLPLVLGLWVLRPRLRPASLLAPALGLACMALTLAPWLARNAVQFGQFGQFVPVTTSAGFAAAGTYNDASHRDGDTHGAWRDPRLAPRLTPLFATRGLDEAGVDAALRREARDFAWHHPGYVAETTAWNLLRLFEVVAGSVVDRSGRAVADRGIGSAVPTGERVGIAVVVALALLGVFAILRSRSHSRYSGEPPRMPSGPLFFWLVPILMILLAAPIAGLPRYRLPADPFLLILAAIGLTWLWDRLATPSRTVG